MQLTLSFGFHILGIIAWMGALLIMTRVFMISTEPSLIRLWTVISRVGLGITLLSGLYQLLSRGLAFYMAEGWFHTKVTAVIVLVVLTILVDAQVKSGNTRNMRLFHNISGVALLATIFLTYLGRNV